MPLIYFYIPRKDWPSEGLPSNPNEYWCGWKPGGHGLTSGVYCWVVLTYLNLKERGFLCEIVSEVPREGIVIAHKTSLDYFQASPKLYLICITADKKSHPTAQFHIVPDKMNTLIRGNKKKTMPHWIQPGLIPRDLKRGDCFENIAYLGTLNSLAPELAAPEWRERLAAYGLTWSLITKGELWNDFSSIDAIVAIRSFSGVDNILKPPQKLFNAWKAGVPIILGVEKGCRALRLSNLDYLEAPSIDDAFAAIERLKKDAELRRRIVQNGKVRVEEFSNENIAKQWVSFLKEVAIPDYYRWRMKAIIKKPFSLLKKYAFKVIKNEI